MQVMINVGRGDLLSEATILAAVDGGQLSHYVGDVFATEPLPSTSALWTHPKVAVKPLDRAVGILLPTLPTSHHPTSRLTLIWLCATQLR